MYTDPRRCAVCGYHAVGLKGEGWVCGVCAPKLGEGAVEMFGLLSEVGPGPGGLSERAFQNWYPRVRAALERVASTLAIAE